MTTCVTLECPFIWYCNQYNFEVDRGDGCEHMEQILLKAKIFDNQRKAARKAARKEDDNGDRTQSPAEIPGE